jgi:aminopeptidase N
LLDGKLNVPGLKIDQDMRWSMIRRLATYGVPGVNERIAAESKRDPSFNGKLASISAETTQPIWENKAKWIAEFKKEKSPYSYTEFGAAFGRMFPPSQEDLHKRYGNQFFSDLLELAKTKDSDYLRTFAYSLAPDSCVASDSQAIDSFLEAHSGLDSTLVKSLRQTSDLNTRCAKEIAFTVGK